MSNIYLIEDHHQALKIWRKNNIRNLDLVHLDAHMDFGFYQAQPVQQAIEQARSINDLKQKLEESVSYLDFEKDFSKQLNIGNYVYPAMQEGVVKDFYWVVPGDCKTFKKGAKKLKALIKKIMRVNSDHEIKLKSSRGIFSMQCLGRDIFVLTLDQLPELRGRLLLDIDLDYLIINSTDKANNNQDIGKRNPWITPVALVEALSGKLAEPKVVTISYSVNGGWTPMKYKHLGDELAYNFDPLRFKMRCRINKEAGRYFNDFQASGKPEYYRKAVKINPGYRAADNNYGPLYLSSGRQGLAKKEFNKIILADNDNPGALFGLGAVAFVGNNYRKASRYFKRALNSPQKSLLFKEVKQSALFALGKVDFFLKHYESAKSILLKQKRIIPLEPQLHYFLGRIMEKEGEFVSAVKYYKDCLRLGFNSVEPLERLVKISAHLEDKNDIISFVKVKVSKACQELRKEKKVARDKRKIASLSRFENRVNRLHNGICAGGCRD